MDFENFLNVRLDSPLTSPLYLGKFIICGGFIYAKTEYTTYPDTIE